MNPIALRTFTNNNIRVFHDGMQAIVSEAILVTHHRAAMRAGYAAASTSCPTTPKNALQTPPFSIDPEHGVASFLQRDETWVAQITRSHRAASDEPAAVLTALRQWKNDFR